MTNTNCTASGVEAAHHLLWAGAGLPGPFQYTLASESVVWVLNVQFPLSWPELEDEQLAQGWTASAKGGLVSAPAVIPVLLILVALCPQNGNQRATKHSRRDELPSWEALLLECITKVLACKSPSTVRQEQTYLIRTLWFPSTSVSHSQALDSRGGGECHWAFHNNHKRFSSRNGQRFREVIFQFHTQNWFA